jgi:NUMOD4 motif/HNH endonuclease
VPHPNHHHDGLFECFRMDEPSDRPGQTPTPEFLASSSDPSRAQQDKCPPVQAFGVAHEEDPPVNEEWRPIRGYEGLYEISSWGRVRTVTTGTIRVGSHHRQGYLSLTLSKKGTAHAYLVHRLVAEAFLGPGPDGMCVNHMNGHKQDNRAANLEYMTLAENNRHAKRLGLARYVRGADIGLAKLTDAAVVSIRQKLAQGAHPMDLARQFNVGFGTIYAIRSGKTWRHTITPSTPPPLPTAKRLARGEQNAHAKLTEDDVRLIRALRESGTPVSEIMRRFNIGHTTVWTIATRRSWKHVK